MDERKSFLLRINPELWKEVEAWAQADLRSVNGQIEFLLKQAVTQRKRSAAKAAAKSPEGAAPPLSQAEPGGEGRVDSSK